MLISFFFSFVMFTIFSIFPFFRVFHLIVRVFIFLFFIFIFHFSIFLIFPFFLCFVVFCLPCWVFPFSPCFSCLHIPCFQSFSLCLCVGVFSLRAPKMDFPLQETVSNLQTKCLPFYFPVLPLPFFFLFGVFDFDTHPLVCLSTNSRLPPVRCTQTLTVVTYTHHCTAHSNVKMKRHRVRNTANMVSSVCIFRPLCAQITFPNISQT